MIHDLELKESIKLLGSNFIGRLSFVFGEGPFILPITYFYDEKEHCILSYANNGHKIAAMRENSAVAMQVDTIVSIDQWHSVLVHGKFEELEGSTAKQYLHRFSEGVQDVISKIEGASPRFIQDFSSRLQKRGMPIVYRINITDITGKYREG